MKIFKVVGMNTDKFDDVLGISVLSKKAFDKLQKENKDVQAEFFPYSVLQKHNN